MENGLDKASSGAASKEAVVKCQVSYHEAESDAGKARKEKEVDTSSISIWWISGCGVSGGVRLSWGISKAWLSPTQVSQGAQQMVTPFYSLSLCFSTELFSTYGCHALFFSAVVIVKILVCHWLLILGSYQETSVLLGCYFFHWCRKFYPNKSVTTWSLKEVRNSNCSQIHRDQLWPPQWGRSLHCLILREPAPRELNLKQFGFSTVSAKVYRVTISLKWLLKYFSFTIQL